ncbi:type IV pilus assembly protein PilV [Duganella sp. CF402]|uniref:type IV pilus modification protein PilV n=1 Tax=unclassified Duganella TaxID=2636909 RepID=UPI0008ACFCC1|nr:MULTISPECIES: type IV pilus modification protein PilV [unclassified Duganella]RZT11437.1 type IV pilus assembly protein PilV [Duganella sp. BK701]SEK64563.1 type IV pilus assembly protein PilV [Duganella sp. CF402]
MRARGFTLLEILIAVLVLALGIIGGVALQMAALRARHQAVLLSQAAQLAAALAEHMRANPAQTDLYLTLNYDAYAEPLPAAPPALCHGDACASAQLAWADIYEAKQQVRLGMPAGRVLVCRDAGVWSGGKLRWACSGGVAAPVVIKVGWRGKNPDGTPMVDDAGEYVPGVAQVVGVVP